MATSHPLLFGGFTTLNRQLYSQYTQSNCTRFPKIQRIRILWPPMWQIKNTTRDSKLALTPREGNSLTGPGRRGFAGVCEWGRTLDPAIDIFTPAPDSAATGNSISLPLSVMYSCDWHHRTETVKGRNYCNNLSFLFGSSWFKKCVSATVNSLVIVFWRPCIESITTKV